MGRTISDDEAIKAAWNVQLPLMRINLPITTANEFRLLHAARGSRAYADMGVWLALCSLASTARGHALKLDYAMLAKQLYGTHGQSTVAAEHVNALIAAGLATSTEDEWLYLPAVDDAMVRHGKMIVGGTRGGRPKKKRRG